MDSEEDYKRENNYHRTNTQSSRQGWKKRRLDDSSRSSKTSYSEYSRKREKSDSRRKDGGSKKRRKHSSSSSYSSTATSHSARSSAERIPPYDDEHRHYKINLGESLLPRYKMLSILGEGTFGKVVECWDREKKKRVAVKIIRAIEKYRDAAMIEIEVLEAIQKADPHAKMPCIQLLSWFDFRNHVCMVFEMYGLSLYDFLKKNRYRPFYLKDIRDFARQLLEAVAFLHELTLIHTDLKPENILLVNSDYDIVHTKTADIRVPRHTKIKLIDFGSATFNSHHHTAVISTRHYRAPEVILGLGWTYPCDLWSVGCILVELLVGEAVFQTHENREHLALMERTFGPLPHSMIHKSPVATKYFVGDRVQFPSHKTSKSSIRHVARQPTLKDLLQPETKAEYQFYDLCVQLLRYEPEARLTAKEALSHPFFSSRDN